MTPDMFWVRTSTHACQLFCQLFHLPLSSPRLTCLDLRSPRPQIFPRSVASKVLTTWTQVVLPCQPGQTCCNLSTLEGEQSLGGGRSPNIAYYDNTRVTYSNWIATFWIRALRGELDGAVSYTHLTLPTKRIV